VSKTEVRRCTCAHGFQDATYGAGHRVHNAMKMKDGKSTGWRCTVCARVGESAGPDRQLAAAGPERRAGKAKAAR
jgi:hypothetical protein